MQQDIHADVLEELQKLRARVSQLEQTEHALRKSEERNRILLSSLPQKIFFKDRDSRFIKVNHSFAQEVGREPDDLVGRTDHDLYPKELADKYRADDQKIMQTKEPAILVEKHTVGDEERYVEVTKTPVINDQGEVVGLFGLFMDVSERVADQRALQKQADQLSKQAKELEERNAEVNNAYSELKEAEAQLIHSERLAAVGQFVSGFAQEIDGPASCVLTNIEAIHRDVSDLAAFANAFIEETESIDPEVARKYSKLRENLSIDEAIGELEILLGSTRSSMNRIRQLVTSLRHYSRGEVRVGRTPFDLAEGIQANLVVVAPIIPDGVKVHLEMDGLPLVECEAGSINQVFLNLCLNAVQAVARNGNIWIRGQRSDDKVRISVVDDGPGIPANIRDRVFDPFFTTKPRAKGAGLGLSIAKRVIDSHHGELELIDAPGKGAHFHVVLPIHQPSDLY